MALDEDREAGSAAGSALVAGLVMVAFGYYAAFTGTSESALYNGSVVVFNWVMRIGGVAMLLVALLFFLNWRPALLLDAACSVLIGLGMLGIGLIWLFNGDGLHGILVMVFGGLFVRSAARNWGSCRGPGWMKTNTAGLQQPADPGPVSDSRSDPPMHSDTVHQAGVETTDEPEGFLAGLGRTDERSEEDPSDKP